MNLEKIINSCFITVQKNLWLLNNYAYYGWKWLTWWKKIRCELKCYKLCILLVILLPSLIIYITVARRFNERLNYLNASDSIIAIAGVSCSFSTIQVSSKLFRIVHGSLIIKPIAMESVVLFSWTLSYQTISDKWLKIKNLVRQNTTNQVLFLPYYYRYLLFRITFNKGLNSYHGFLRHYNSESVDDYLIIMLNRRENDKLFV